MKKTLLLTLLVLACSTLSAKDYELKSPDGRIELSVSAGASLKFSVTYDGKELIKASNIGLELKSGKILGENERVRKIDVLKLDEIIRPVISNRRSEIKDRCNILEITFRSGFLVEFRAYDDGIAYRFETQMKDELTVRNETVNFDFPRKTTCWYPFESSFFSHNERTYIYSSADTIDKESMASLPVLFSPEGVNVLITESDIDDYPGMWLISQGSGKISGIWPRYPDNEELKTDRDLVVKSTKNYIAKTEGKRTFPWRVFIISATDAGLTESDLVFRLAKPSQLKETEWIKPGQVAWDWWNANNLKGVDFRAGINNNTYKYYIDFASANGLEYIILDEGWYENNDVTDEADSINVYDLCEYGRSKNVGVILWVIWKSYEDKMEEASALYEKWGVKGVKIDFMQRDDQKMVNFYHEASRVAANHHLLVDFHGAYKPDGISRTWPNVLTREGVKGMEVCKWSDEVNPEHAVTIPFIRMVAGAMDFTPGAMVNMTKENFSPKFTQPESQGTRAHQVAMYVVYESPLQMLADSPTNYMREQETTDYITKIPVVWDDIKCLDGKVGDYIILARRSGKDWFIGAMTDWEERTLDLDFTFLPEGNYKMEIFEDGINADRNASDYRITESEMRSGGRTRIHMAPGGGWAARLTPLQ